MKINSCIVATLWLCANVLFAQNNPVNTSELRLININDSTVVKPINGNIYYNKQSNKFRVYENSVWKDITGSSANVLFGTSGQIPVMNTTNNNFTYSNKFKWDNTKNNLIGAGNGASIGASATNVAHFGSNTAVDGSWVLTNAEESIIRVTAGNSISSGFRNEMGDGVGAFSGLGGQTMGQDSHNFGVNDFVGGVGGKSLYTGASQRCAFVWAFQVGSGNGDKPAGVPYLLAHGQTFNISRNTASQIDGNGALGLDGGILGGIDHHIPIGIDRSVILGGSAITAFEDDTDYFPYVNVTGPSMIGPKFGLSDSNISHGMTSVIPETYVFRIQDYDGGDGGAQIYGASSGVVPSLVVQGLLGDTAPTATAVEIRGSKRNGTGVQDLAGTENIFSVANNDDATPKIVVTGDGRIYGTAIHNNAGSVTGTTNQYFASGTHPTPTLFNTSNVAASVSFQTQWSRIGNTVEVSGNVEIDPSAPNSNTVLGMEIPIPSDFTASENCGGTANSLTVIGQSAGIVADPINDRVLIQYINQSTANAKFSFTYKYLIQ